MSGSTTLRLPRFVGHKGAKTEYTYLFDTNAVRWLAKLSYKEWSRLKRAIKNDSATTAWIPWVLMEAIGTNLDRDHVTKGYLFELQKAAKRYDYLAKREILCNADELFEREAYRVADFSYPKTKEIKSNYRETLNLFLRIKKLKQIVIDKGPPLYLRFMNKQMSQGYDANIPNAFATEIESNIAKRKEEISNSTTEPLKHLDLTQEAIDWFSGFLGCLCRRFSLPEELIKALLSQEKKNELLESCLSYGITMGHYQARRISGEAQKVRRNDGKDLMISGYLPLAGCFVTNDNKLTKQLKRVFAAPERVITCSQFANFYQIASN